MRESKFKCDLCDHKFTEDRALKKHIENVYEGIKPFKCNICDYKTTQGCRLKKHIETAHEGIKPFKCNICDYETAEGWTLKKHIELVHKGIKSFKCSLCDFKTVYKQSLKKHMVCVHDGIKKCDFPDCGKTFLGRKAKSNYENHQKKHLISNDKKQQESKKIVDLEEENKTLQAQQNIPPGIKIESND